MRFTRPDRNDKGAVLLPEVIIDFECEQDSLFLVIANVGSSSVHSISVRCDKEVWDFRGKQIARMDIFRRLEFLPPGKRIRLFVNKFSAYIREKQPLRLEFVISYYDRDRRKQTDIVRHNLAIFKGVVTPAEKYEQTSL